MLGLRAECVDIVCQHSAPQNNRFMPRSRERPARMARHFALLRMCFRATGMTFTSQLQCAS